MTNLLVAHNISLGTEPTNGLAIDERGLAQTAARVLGTDGRDARIDPAQKVGKILLAERQLVEIAKVLTLRAAVLIFDEPTAALGQADVDRLFRIVEGLRDEGVGDHLRQPPLQGGTARSATARPVLRNGQRGRRVAGAETSAEHLVELTLGQKVATAFHRDWRAEGRGAELDLRDVHVGAGVRGVDLTAAGARS